MRLFLRLCALFKPYMGWMVLGVFLSCVSTVSSITLMGVSGWFITAMGLAGVTGVALNYFTPAAIIRACAILRTGGRYAERLVTHEATFRLIAALRVWFYKQLEPLAPAALSHKRSGDLLSHLRGDIDRLERFYLAFGASANGAVGQCCCDNYLWDLYPDSSDLDRSGFKCGRFGDSAHDVQSHAIL